MAGKEAKKSVLFVCYANYCRSPIAEAVFVDLVAKRGLTNEWNVDSAAISDWHLGKLPDERGRSVLQSHGITTQHRARLLTEDDFERFDYIFGMDNGNMMDLAEIKPPGSKAKLETLAVLDPQGLRDVRDPYHEGKEGFERVYQQCVRCLECFLENVQ